MRGGIDCELCSVGNTDLFYDLKIDVPVTKLEGEGKAVIIVKLVSGAVGLIAFRDKIREFTIFFSKIF